MDNNNVNLTTIAAWVSLGLAVGGLGVTFGVVKGVVDQNSRDIAQLQADSRNNSEKLTDIRLDVKDIKARFEILVPTDTMKRSEDRR